MRSPYSVPCWLCMATTPVPGRAAITSAMPGSPRSPQTSLTITAPASSAAAATVALRVSMLIGTDEACRELTDHRQDARHLNSAETDSRVLDGRVLSPPTSTMSAPSAASELRTVHGGVDVVSDTVAGE